MRTVIPGSDATARKIPVNTLIDLCYVSPAMQDRVQHLQVIISRVGPDFVELTHRNSTIKATFCDGQFGSRHDCANSLRGLEGEEAIIPDSFDPAIFFLSLDLYHDMLGAERIAPMPITYEKIERVTFLV